MMMEKGGQSDLFCRFSSPSAGSDTCFFKDCAVWHFLLRLFCSDAWLRKQVDF